MGAKNDCWKENVATMADGSGTTVYGYNPVPSSPTLGADLLANIDGLTSDTITFAYDELGRVSNRSINGAANSESWSFDSLGRVSTDANKLGSFNYAYVGVTGRLQTLTYPGGTTANYTYDTEGKLKTWTKNYPGLATSQRSDLGYDNAGQLLMA